MVSEYRYHYHQLANCPFKADKVAEEKTFLLNVAQRLGPLTETLLYMLHLTLKYHCLRSTRVTPLGLLLWKAEADTELTLSASPTQEPQGP